MLRQQNCHMKTECELEISSKGLKKLMLEPSIPSLEVDRDARALLFSVSQFVHLSKLVLSDATPHIF